jgi:hypothetical protein
MDLRMDGLRLVPVADDANGAIWYFYIAVNLKACTHV